MGLLDDFKMPGMDTPEGQGLLSAAFSLMSAQKRPGQKGAFAGALGDAGQQYMQATNSSRDQMQRRKYLDAQMEAQQMQLEAVRAKQMAAQKEEAERQRVMGLIGNAGRVAPGMGAGLSPADAGSLPPEFQISANIPALQTPGKIDYQNLYRQGVPLDMLKGLSESATLGKPKVKNIETVNVGGKPMKVGIDEYGQQVAQIGMEWRPLKTQDMGGYVGTFDETNPGAGITKLGDKTQSAESRASNAVAMRGQNMTRQNALDRIELDNRMMVTDSGGPEQVALTRRFGKAPPGWRWKADGSQEAIPGGPADIKAGEAGAKTEARRQSQAAQASSVLGIIGEAKSLVGPTTAGFGAFAANIPASDARDLQAKLETIKANLGFDRLQQMREQSPTGGALGAVAVQELTALQSTVASLDQKQSPTQLKAGLDKIERHYKKWQEAVDSASKPNSGGAGGGWDGPKPDWVFKDGKLIKAN